MKICALEMPACFGDPRGELDHLRAALAGGEPADLFLVPECALTGYVSPELHFDLRPFAEPLDGPTTRAYRALAREHGSHLDWPTDRLLSMCNRCSTACSTRAIRLRAGAMELASFHGNQQRS